MAKKELFRYSSRGGLAKNEDWYYLVTDDQGKRSVVHEWDYMFLHRNTPSSRDQSRNTGSRSYSIEEFIAAYGHNDAKDKLKDLLEPQPA